MRWSRRLGPLRWEVVGNSNTSWIRMILLIYSVAILVLSAIPAALAYRNLPVFRTAARRCEDHAERGVSVLIPARNEALGIAETIHSVTRSEYSTWELILLDDDSSDDTAAIVARFAENDPRIQLKRSDKLPEGWNGKQHACWQLAKYAQYDLLLFIDADVRVRPDGLSRITAQREASDVELLSGFPRQQMRTTSEKMLIPMMYYLLLGYLPLEQMRANTNPEFGAGCGQMFLAKREAYFAVGGHEVIRSSRHDGLKLPRSFRNAGFRTDLFDASDIAEVRMYEGVWAVIRGVLKNATEGIANAKLIGLFTILLIGGSVAPVFSFAHAVFYGWIFLDAPRMGSTVLLGLAMVLSYLPRWQIARQLGHPLAYVAIHPISVMAFMGLQWLAFLRAQLGVAPVPWRGRPG